MNFLGLVLGGLRTTARECLKKGEEPGGTGYLGKYCSSHKGTGGQPRLSRAPGKGLAKTPREKRVEGIGGALGEETQAPNNQYVFFL